MRTNSSRYNLGAMFLLGALLMASPASLLYGQVTASLLGTVKDASGAAVAGVSIQITNLDTGLNLETKSDASGGYRLMAVPVGRYRLDASQPGFETFAAENIELTVNEQRRQDIAMQVGSVQQQLKVTANPVQVETASTQLGVVIGEKKIVDLPLDGRSYLDLLTLQAGVVQTGSQPTSGDPRATPLTTAVNGQRGTSDAFLLNGGDVSEARNFGASLIPNLDSVQEFRLITNGFDAQYGRFSGGIMNVVTKSGTNSIHGTVFEFFRNTDMDAKGFFEPTVPQFKQNQFGFAAGGPLIKNRLFWFSDYQGTRNIQGAATGLVNVASMAERTGDFSPSQLSGKVVGSYWAGILSQRLGYQVTSGEPYSATTCTSAATCVFPGGVIPTSAFSAPAVAMLKYIPLPNAGTALYDTSNANTTLEDNRGGQRVDLATEKTGQWSFYYVLDDSTTTSPLANSSYGGFGTITPAREQETVVSNTYTLGPSAVNEFRLSYFRHSATGGEPQDPTVNLASLGFVTGVGTLGIVPTTPPGAPRISITGLSAFGRGNFERDTQNSYQLQDDFSKVHDKHTLRFGVEVEYIQLNARNQASGINGSFTFNGGETGNGFADFLLGAPSSYNQYQPHEVDSRTRYFGVYAQDQWRATSKLTINYGLRYEFSMPWYDTQNRLETWVLGEQSVIFPTAPVGYLVPGDPGIPSTLAPTQYAAPTNFAPRLGIAYSLNSKTSIRAAAGVFNTALQDATTFDVWGDPPYFQGWTSISPPLFEEPFLTRATGVSQGQRFPIPRTVDTPGANATLNYSIFEPLSGDPGYFYKNKMPYAMNDNFTIQRQLTRNMLLTTSYVGTQGRKLIASTSLNPGNPALCLSLTGSGVMAGTLQCGPNQESSTFTLPNGSKVIGTRGPYGVANGVGNDNLQITAANSHYNALQVTVERQAGDMNFLAAYTWSKSTDNASSFSEPNLIYSNFGLSEGLSDFDIAQYFVVSYTYNLPLARLRGFRAAPKRLVDGWSIAGITRFSTGAPVNLTESGDRSLTATGLDRPNCVGSLVLQTNPRQGRQYFNTSAFAAETLGTFGTCDARFFNGPGINNFDLSLHKNTTLFEHFTLQFRAEFFNAFNHAQFTNPDGAFNDATFGQITSDRGGRIGQLSLKLLF